MIPPPQHTHFKAEQMAFLQGMLDSQLFIYSLLVFCVTLLLAVCDVVMFWWHIFLQNILITDISLHTNIDKCIIKSAI